MSERDGHPVRRVAVRLGAAVLVILASGLVAAAGLALDSAERDWLSRHPAPLRVGVIEIPPLVIRGGSAGAYNGMAIDFLHTVGKTLGTRTEVVLYPNWKAVLDAGRDKEVDLLLTAVDTPERRAFLNFSAPYVTLRNVIIGRQAEADAAVDLAQLSGKRVAVLEASAIHERLLREFPLVRVYPLREERSLLSAVAFHEADFAITELSRAVWWMQEDKLSVLRVVGITPFDYNLAFAVRKDWPELASALGKAVAAMSRSESDSIISQWAQLDADPWLERPAAGRQMIWIGVAVLLVAVAALTVLYFLRRRLVAQAGDLVRMETQAESLRRRLADAERNFRELADLTSDIFWETDQRLVLVRYYGGALLAGVVDSELLGRAWWELAPARADVQAFRQLRAMMEQRQPFRRWQCRFSDAAGGVRWLSLSGKAILDDAGAFVGYRGAGQDITDRMQQQQRLSVALERMQAVHDGTYSFLGLLSPDGRMLDCNRSALEFIGRQKSDVIGQLFWDLPWWNLADEAERVIEAVAAAGRGEFVRFDARVVDTAGATHWVDFSLSPFYDEWGNLRYLVPEARDITEAKRASTALDNLMSSTGSVFGEAFFRQVVESMGRLLAVKYVLIGKLQARGQQVRTVAVWAGEGHGENIDYELRGSPCDGVVHLGCCVYPHDVQLLFPEDRLLFELGVHAYAGMPIIGSSGQAIGILAAMHDKPLVETASMRRMLELFAVRAATEFERMAYEEEIRALNAGLEARVTERTEALQQANRELEAFSYSVSHDLRAPLRHISGFVEMLTDEAGASLSSEGRRYLDVISQSASRMGVMIDDLLAFSRAGRSEVRKVRLDLRQLVDETIGQMERDLAGRHIDWRIGELPAINADRGLISLVLANLIGNAVKYSRKRDPAIIQIGIDATRAQPGECVLFVRDNGIGFDMRYAHKLFGVFQRLHNDSEYEGTGIGLANVRRIVERHGGRVWAESTIDQGSTFYFTLPAVFGAGQAVALAA